MRAELSSIEPDDLLSEASRLLGSTPLVDGHNDLAYAVRTAAAYDLTRMDLSTSQPSVQTDIPRLRSGGVGAQFWSAYVPVELERHEAVTATIEQVMFIHQLAERYPADLALATSATDVQRIFDSGRIASLIGLEGGHSMANSLHVLRGLFRLGARYMTLTHTSNTDWADSSTDHTVHGGLSVFGEQVIAEMNRLGMLVDLSHVSSATMHHALDVSEAPVIFSHSCCRALCDVPRNVPDDVLERLPALGGVLMVAFVPSFLSAERSSWEAEHAQRCDEGATEVEIAQWATVTPRPRVTVEDVADHIDHARDVAGIDCIGIGSDYDGCVSFPEGLPDVGSYPVLVAELLRRRYSPDDVAKVVGQNVLRALQDNERVSRRLANGAER